MFSFAPAHKNTFTEMAEFKECLEESATNLPAMMAPAVQQSQQWNPYVVMGGTCAAISGPDYVVVASDTRMSQWEVNIMTRNCEKIHLLSDKIILGTCGFYGDVLQLKQLLSYRLNNYKFNYQHPMSVDMLATMLARTLYYRRFFPYYTGSILAGIDSDGKGAVYSYDPVGTIKRVTTDCSGTGAQILQPFLDIKVDQCTQAPGMRRKQPMALEEAKMLMRDAFRAVCERESTTGDSIKLVSVSAKDKEPNVETIQLRED